MVQGLEKTMLNQDIFTEFAKMSFLYLNYNIINAIIIYFVIMFNCDIEINQVSMHGTKGQLLTSSIAH